jgi:hypothetical protein
MFACVQVCALQIGSSVGSVYIKIVCIFLSFIKWLVHGSVCVCVCVYELVNDFYWIVWKSDSQFSSWSYVTDGQTDVLST